MSSRFVFLLLAATLAPFACGPDPKPKAPCGEGPDFDVLITAEHGKLPADTTVVLIYGSGREEYHLSAPGTPEVLFCGPTDREGQPLEAGIGDASAGAGGATDGAGGSAGNGGSGGSGAAAGRGAEALRCALWTQGPATLEITAQGYPEHRTELELVRGQCTVPATIELLRGDAGL